MIHGLRNGFVPASLLGATRGFGDGNEHGWSDGDGSGYNCIDPDMHARSEYTRVFACPDPTGLAAALINALVRPK